MTNPQIANATYSPEDNKIRLYPAERLDAGTFEKVKAAGFKWAPKQGLFVAPKWSPRREDLAIELAGEIGAEQMTLAERAQAKAERLETLAGKRADDANAYQRRARELSEQFGNGQPILAGHHSERKALKAQEKAESAQANAVKAHDLAGYWLYRATGVERHANYKNDPRTRARRIKTLLAELRDFQRRLNEAHKALSIWEAMTTPEQIRIVVGSGIAAYGLWSRVNGGEITPEAARAEDMAGKRATISSPIIARYIAHTLNRLAYETELLGDVPRFGGDLTPVIIQQFLREHGADKPAAKKVDCGLFAVECDAPLPVHIGDGSTAEMSGDEWRDLMQECGFVPPAKKPAKPPILNLESPTGVIHVQSRATYRGAESVDVLPVVGISKADYSAIGSDYRGTRLSACGQFRVRVTLNPTHTGPAYKRGWAVVFIENQKKHPAPESARFDALEPVE
ncbi:DUF3560 domain-containing protein [Shimia sp.]|uniref:DUF3560 domain-containing protein n=1 Tax=Shimia sp. TaxID=1954381 RepID=UPI003298BDFD